MTDYTFNKVWKYLRAKPYCWKSKKAPANDLSCDYIYYCGAHVMKGADALVEWANAQKIFDNKTLLNDILAAHTITSKNRTSALAHLVQRDVLEVDESEKRTPPKTACIDPTQPDRSSLPSPTVVTNPLGIVVNEVYYMFVLIARASQLWE
jgi:hypothetical protein